jgi:hypothetical protein
VHPRRREIDERSIRHLATRPITRHVVYEIDGARFIESLEAIVREAKALAPRCCPPRD